MSDPLDIAAWRYEQIAPLVDDACSDAEKRRYLLEKSALPVEWPQSEADSRAGKPPRCQKIGKSTLRHWVRLYCEQGFAGLLPSPRKDKGRSREDRSAIVAFALALLCEQPGRSLTQLMAYIKIEFPDTMISRSTLNRELNAHPAYQGILREREGKGKKLRDLCDVLRPHECWQLDGKGPFRVTLTTRDEGGHVTGRQTVTVHVLSVIDAHSRCVLASIISPSESLAAAVRVTRLAMARWGVPDRLQFDRGSAFDAKAFRAGLAMLGTHRNWVKAGDPESQGRIEAFHRSLTRLFVKELSCQEVIDLVHLEGLLQAAVDGIYNRQHTHRVLKMTPHAALAGCLCARRVSDADLAGAFWVTTTNQSDRKTGIVRLPNGMFRVPVRYAGHRHNLRYDPACRRAELVTHAGQEIPLDPYDNKPAFENQPRAEPRGTGQLQKIYDVWRGAERPNAQPGFGLPEVFRLIADELLKRQAPRDEREAQAITRFYREFGPLPAEPFRRAIEATRRALGADRPLRSYLDHLARLARNDQNSTSTTDEETTL